MKLLQANIWGGRLSNQLIDILAKEKADILCFQEIISTKGDGFIFETLENIKKQLGYEYSFFSPVFDINLMQKTAGFGNAILSKLPFESTNTVFTRLEHKNNFDFDLDDYNIRNFQHASININGQLLHVLNHHGHHVHQNKNGDKETMRQCGIIADYIKQLKGAVILVGDFNLAPHSESLEQINGILRNLSVKFDLKTTRTSLTNKTEVCDYIFVSEDIKVTEFFASDDIFSDHKALILEFSI
ncbi:MAG: endonuclease/exonuclease/phosphatase family protein [bacterium]|nr:endonuclease/exonuclease/phosphatase family protein [bacterium]